MRVVLATVVGPVTWRDLSLPADAPTEELLPTLVRLLGGSRPAEGAAGWTLITAGGSRIPTWASLADQKVLHGEFLYLTREEQPEQPLPAALRHLAP